MKKLKLTLTAGTVTYTTGGNSLGNGSPIQPDKTIKLGPNTKAGIGLGDGKPLFVLLTQDQSGKTTVKTLHPVAKRGVFALTLKKSATNVITLKVAETRRKNEYQVNIQM